MLEEGLATVFSEDYVARYFQAISPTNLHSYVDDASKVRQLMALYPGAIKALREVEPCFKKMTPETFVNAGLHNVTEALVSELLAPFRLE